MNEFVICHNIQQQDTFDRKIALPYIIKKSHLANAVKCLYVPFKYRGWQKLYNVTRDELRTKEHFDGDL